ncbi:MAG: DNA alkylation repair protein [Crocinitomicaceae bacterium]|nr:DNA alkylation repair protein [Crocinitomicaceae bacterium]
MIKQIQSSFQESRNPEIAPAMEAYMKNHFKFLGIKSPDRRELARQFGPELRKWNQQELIDLCLQLWKLEEREYQYLALDILKWKYKKPQEKDLQWIKELIVSKSWWDTVDLLASHTLGLYLISFPEKRVSISNDWIQSDHLWLQRSTLIFQLKYKNVTDTDLLFQNILRLNSNRDFFIQKAIGWSLRELSKTDKRLVQQFLDAHPEIDKLARREASKYL